MEQFVINENDSGQRVDKFISKAMPDLPKSMMYKLIRKKDIKLNGKRCEISEKLHSGDVLTVYVKSTLSQKKSHDMSFMKAPQEISTIFEDGNIIIVNKPVGLDSHSNGSEQIDTMINRIKRYLYEKGEYLPENESSFAPALCSRLDRNTNGLVTAAKNAVSLREINEAIRGGQLHKIYHCVTVGELPRDCDIVHAYHKKDEGRNIVRIVDEPKEGFKPIKTGYKLLARKNGLSLYEITLYTGRTHQIRAHLAHLGAPVLGDGKYGNIPENKRFKIFRQMLCAYGLEFELPETSPLHYLNEINIHAPLPRFEVELMDICQK